MLCGMVRLDRGEYTQAEGISFLLCRRLIIVGVPGCVRWGEVGGSHALSTHRVCGTDTLCQ